MEYFLYPKNQCITREESDKFTKSIHSAIDVILHESNAFTWYKDQIKLVPRYEEKLLSKFLDATEILPYHLYGVFDFENVEDEWFLVYILYELSKKIEDLIVRVIDNDGEFLLIEAAPHLPKWAEPEICEKRVYVTGGKLHIVSPKNAEGGGEAEICTEEALEEIR